MILCEHFLFYTLFFELHENARFTAITPLIPNINVGFTRIDIPIIYTHIYIYTQRYNICLFVYEPIQLQYNLFLHMHFSFELLLRTHVASVDIYEIVEQVIFFFFKIVMQKNVYMNIHILVIRDIT